MFKWFCKTEIGYFVCFDAWNALLDDATSILNLANKLINLHK